MINSQQFFQWMVRHHTTVNLAKCLPYLEGGRVYQNGMPLREGFGENKHYPGTLIIADGEGLIGRLIKDEVIDEVEGERQGSVRSGEDLSLYLTGLINTDGAHIYDSATGAIVRTPEVSNAFRVPKRMLYHSIPQDFLSLDGSVPKEQIGLKTRMAIKLPQAPGYEQIEVFQIKQTPYGELGMGKVAHFSAKGLVEEFFLAPNQDPLQASLDPGNSIQGVYRRYAKAGDRLVRIAEEVRSLHQVYGPALALNQ